MAAAMAFAGEWHDGARHANRDEPPGAAVITYDIDADAHRVTCHVTGSLRAADVGNFIERLWLDPHIKRDFDTLVFVDDVTVAPDLIARTALAELLLARRRLNLASKWALILPGSAWQRLAAQLIDAYGLAGRKVRYFADATEAMSWLHVAPVSEQAH